MTDMPDQESQLHEGAEHLEALTPEESVGDSGDQAQRLQMAEEQEAIAAALAGHPRGDDNENRDARVEFLEGEDPVLSPDEEDSSDDPTFGGGDRTGIDPSHQARALLDDES